VDHGDPISYLALAPGTEVLGSDGVAVGAVEHVLADEREDVFDGIVIDALRGPGGMRFADADDVAAIYERAVVLKLSAAEAGSLPEPTPAPATMEAHGLDGPEGALRGKLHRAWDRISGNY
jgi:hypothetical protein